MPVLPPPPPPPRQGLAEEHYKDLKDRPFFPDLVSYIVSGPVIATVWEGPGVIAGARKVIGATNPAVSEPGTIRGDLAVEVRGQWALVLLASLASEGRGALFWELEGGGGACFTPRCLGGSRARVPHPCPCWRPPFWRMSGLGHHHSM